MESLSGAEQWEVFPLLSKEQFQAVEEAGIDSLHAQLLYNRGIKTVEEMKAFIRAQYDETRDPLTLIDMPRAVARIRQALENREHITVYGDYDADGVTSSALLFRVLRTLKQPDAALDYHIPHRLRDGCGLNIAALDQLKARGTQLIITTDCASSDVEQVAYAQAQGMDVIITDHHHPPAELPQAWAMVNPWRPDCAYGERYLCGVGIAFKLSQALYRAYGRDREEEMDLLDLVAVGTVADIAPLLGENHTLVRLGMQRLNATRKPGLQALIRHAGLQPGRIRERDIAFALAPRINAAGRMQDASIAFELLVTDNEEEAQACVAQLEQLNLSRQQQTEELMRNVREQARLQPGKPVVLVNGDDWHEGIIGLVAGKLAEEINKPVLVLSNDRGTHLSRGSARSQKNFNIIEALRGFAAHLERYGGHAQAAGFTIRSERIEALHDHLLRWKENGGTSIAAVIEGTELPDQTGVVTESETENTPAPQPHMVDLIFTRMERLNYNLYKSLRMLSPFGAGNTEPTFKMEGLRLLDKWSSGINKQNLGLRLGSTKGNAQLKGTLTRGAPRHQSLTGITHVNVIFRIESMEDEVRQEVWLKILDIEPVQ
ncbi:MAG TPA: single-stranded-DNA-specific exonuclease RecJ [Ktedonosporobacter sp.]|nr:single-stranded-DNA-specific exonuclease RecJ [Ktedonosporobacter sp.]